MGMEARKVNQILKGLLITKNGDMLPPVGDRKPKEIFDQGDGIKYICCSWLLWLLLLWWWWWWFVRLEVRENSSRRMTE